MLPRSHIRSSGQPCRISAVVHALVFAVALPGCAALPLAVLSGGMQAGGGALVKTGTEYTASGAVYRTFAIPLADVHAAVLEAFHRTDIAVAQDEASPKGQRVVGEAQHRTVRVRLTPLTPALTQMELVVKRNLLASDTGPVIAPARKVRSATSQIRRPRASKECHCAPAPAENSSNAAAVSSWSSATVSVGPPLQWYRNCGSSRTRSNRSAEGEPASSNSSSNRCGSVTSYGPMSNV